MEDTSWKTRPSAEGTETAAALGDLLREHRGGDVAVLDLRGQSSWTDFFVIATVSSGAHQQGLERHIKEFARERGIEILRRSRKAPTGESSGEWRLIDMGSIVIHLMSAPARSFYELERLWGPGPHHSSKSS
ncbi:MAG: ribosome silencing factor [Treponema sp.]|jgi:ribosome-associated protein|nr:ribosome silencing factor [Treponema sp.]